MRQACEAFVYSEGGCSLWGQKALVVGETAEQCGKPGVDYVSRPDNGRLWLCAYHYDIWWKMYGPGRT
jgi:hypothetical protein